MPVGRSYHLCHLALMATFGTISSFSSILSLMREETLMLSAVDHVLFKESFRARTIYKAVILYYERCWTVVAILHWPRQVSIYECLPTIWLPKPVLVMLIISIFIILNDLSSGSDFVYVCLLLLWAIKSRFNYLRQTQMSSMIGF